MGIAKRIWMEMQEEEACEAKAEWIREQLDNDEADECTDGWDELSEEYDNIHEYSDMYEDDWSVVGKSRVEIFEENIESTHEILTVSLSPSSSKNLFVMLHAHVVAAVEAYLSSTFIEKALSTEQHMRLLVENDPEFAKRKFTIKEIFTKRDELKNVLSLYLKKLIFHDIAKVKPLYLSVLKIDFGEINWLFEAVALRHHCVHRAGYDKDGNEIHLTSIAIEELINDSVTLIGEIESALISMPDNGGTFWEI
ncbi:MAG: hypothetical protein KAT06_01235 [Gammaproteobacteria bacterium]|nr:hypothetical protein [Gammaproteobacteria bacterium]